MTSEINLQAEAEACMMLWQKKRSSDWRFEHPLATLLTCTVSITVTGVKFVFFNYSVLILLYYLLENVVRRD